MLSYTRDADDNDYDDDDDDDDDDDVDDHHDDVDVGSVQFIDTRALDCTRRPSS